jgi:hypothetical protein
MSFFRFLFPRKSKVTIGSLWVHQDVYDNPFDRKIVYKVDDVKGNWVRYKVCGKCGYTSIDSMRIDSFYAFFRQIKELPPNIIG